MEVEGTALLSREITQLIRDEILGVVRSAKLGQTLEDSVLTALSGPTRVLPEGKTNLCSALTFLSHSSAAQKALMSSSTGNSGYGVSGGRWRRCR